MPDIITALPIHVPPMPTTPMMGNCPPWMLNNPLSSVVSSSV